MRLKVVGTGGISCKLTLSDDATLKMLVQMIQEGLKVSGNDFGLRVGYPPQMIHGLPLTALSDLGIKNGDSISFQEGGMYPLKGQGAPEPCSGSVGMERKVIAADNSCLFNALGYCKEGPGFDASVAYRKLIADAIDADAEVYTAAFLGKPPSEYKLWIQDTEKWGGEIEISILSKALSVDIWAVDVMTTNIFKYSGDMGSDVPCCVIVLYDGIHYDALVRSVSSGEEQRLFYPTIEEEVEREAKALAQELREKKQFTNLEGFDLRCMVCETGLIGQKGAQEHAKQTGHTNFCEMNTPINISLSYEAYRNNIQNIDMRPSRQQGTWQWLRAADRLTLKRVHEYAEMFSPWRVRLRRERLGDEKWLDMTLQTFNDGHFLEAEACAYGYFDRTNLTDEISWAAYGHFAVLSQVAIQRGQLEQARLFGLRSIAILQALAPPHWEGKVALLKLQLLLVVPTVPLVAGHKPRAEMVLSLQQFRSNLQHQLPLSEFLRTLSVSRYLLPYQGLNDRQVNTELNKALVALTPELKCYTCSHNGTRESHHGIKVGFVSKHLDSHSIGMSLMPLLVGLASRAEVELFLFYVTDSSTTADEGVKGSVEPDEVKSELMRALGARFVVVPEDIHTVRHRISEEHLHVLVYPDVGLDPITLALTQARLAPVQAQWWGHPITSGSKHIDFFLGLDVERPDASEAQYVEQLVRFQNPNVSPKIQRSAWRLPVVQGRANMTDDQQESFERLLETLRLPHLIGMPLGAFSFAAVLGRAFKFSGPFLHAIASLLHSFTEKAQYREMYVVVIAEQIFDSNAAIYAHVLRCLETMSDITSEEVEEAMQRLRFLDYGKYFDLLAAPVTRVVLDTYPFGGCLSTVDAFSHGLPVVTLDHSSASLRGLFTTSMYMHMREPTLQSMTCAATQEAYIQGALRLLDSNFTAFAKTIEAVQRGYKALLGTSTALTDEFVDFIESIS